MPVLNVPGAYPTIAAALAVAVPGDLVQIAAGYGAETVTVNVDNVTFNAPIGVSGIVLHAGAAVATIVLGSSAAAGFTIYGNGLANTIHSGAGNDALNGGDGGDTFVLANSSEGVDIFNGGAGADSLQFQTDVRLSRLTLNAAASVETISRATTFDDPRGTTGADIWDISGVTGYLTLSTGSTAPIPIYLDAGGDIFTGSTVADEVHGEDGDDTLNGGGGADTIWGEAGNDTLNGGDGDDHFAFSGSANGVDTFIGGAGTDSLFLTADAAFVQLTLNAAASVERIRRTTAFDDLNGTTGVDVWNISGVTSYLTDSTCSNAPIAISLKAGADIFTGSSIGDLVYGDDGDDTLNGGGGNDTIWGGAGADTLNGDAGDDDFAFSGSANGVDTFNGGAGTDSLYLTSDVPFSQLTLAAAASVERIKRDTAFNDLTGTTGVDTWDISGVTSYLTISTSSTAPIAITLDAGNDVFTGSSVADLVYGEVGDDTLNGGGGNDTIYGGAGADTLNGGDGDDDFAFASASNGIDVFNGGAGLDSLFLTGDSTFQQITLDGATSVERVKRDTTSQDLFGTTGADTWNFSGVTSYLTQSTGSNAGIGIYFSDGADSFIGSATGDLVYGENGADTLRGGGGADALYGGPDNDLLYGDDGADTIYAGSGDDFIDGGTGTSSILGGEGGADTIYGGAGADYMIGGEGNDVLVGLGGQDSLYGGQGDDYIVAGNGPGSVVDGGAGANTLWGAGGADYMIGGEGNDLLVGGAGSDYQFGNGGADTHYGGQGTDFIFTNSGNDFVWTDDVGAPQSTDYVYAGGGTGTDTVADFTPGGGANHDVLVVSLGSGVTTFAQAQAKMSQVGVYTVLKLGADQVYIYNVQPFQLTADNFLFL